MNDSIPEGSRFLVTGGAGFIGSHVADKLIKMGHRVTIVDDLSTGKIENVHPEALFYEVAVEDGASLARIFAENNPEYIIHEAAKINLNVMLEDPVKDVKSSVLGVLNLLKLSVDYKIKKFIYASSVAVYGRPVKLPAVETDPLVPIYSYGIAKKTAEEYVKYYSDYYGLNYSILRYANVYGPRQPVYGEVGVIAIFIERVVKGEPLIIYGSGDHLRDFIYIEDVVDVTVGMISGGGERGIFNVGCGIGITPKQLYEQFCELCSGKLPIEWKNERKGELGYFYCDIDNITKKISFLPRVSLKEGISKTLSHYGVTCGK